MTRDEATMEVIIDGHIPSVNNLYDLHKPKSEKDSARIYISKQGQKFHRLFARMAKLMGLKEIFDAHGLRGKTLEFYVVFRYPRLFDAKGEPLMIDADNPEKALFDGFKLALGVDDSWNFKHTTEKVEGGKRPRTIVRIRPYQGPVKDLPLDDEED